MGTFHLVQRAALTPFIPSVQFHKLLAIFQDTFFVNVQKYFYRDFVAGPIRW